MATEKFAISAQAPGFVSFNGPITDSSSSSPTIHLLNIPSGMINIGGLGKGYVIDADPSFQFVGNLANNQYIIYARIPTASDPGGSATGKAIVDSSTVKSFSNYAVSGAGDTATQRAFCYFRVRNGLIDPESIITFRSGTTTRKTTSIFPGIEDPILRTLEKMGFYVNGTTDFNYTKRGQYVDEEVLFDNDAVNPWDIVYKNTDGTYYRAIATDTLSEKVVGIADIDRDSVTDNNFVIASGFVDIGTSIPSGSSQQNILDSTDYPAGTYLYLSGATAGVIVRDFDKWGQDSVPQTYSIGDRIAEASFVWEANPAGVSAGSEPDFAGVSGLGLGSTITDNANTWTVVAVHDPAFIPITDGGVARKIRIGTALGSGVMLLTPGAGSIDDHDEAANAHLDIQTAINKAGIYVVNADQGLPVTDVEYRGQGFHEEATFSGFSVGDRLLVYRHSGGSYQKAIAGISGEASENVIGISYNIDTGAQPNTVLTSGFVNIDTSAISVGEPIYLSDSIAGALSAVPGGATGDTGIRVGTCIISATQANGGLMLLHLGSAEELDAHNEDVDSHSVFQLAMARAGIFVASSVLYSHAYVGQGFDEDSIVFAGGATYGEPVYLSLISPNTYSPAIADATAAQKVVGIAVNELGTGTPNAVATGGYIDVGSKMAFAAGTDVYLSPTTPGDYTSTPSNVKLGFSLGNNTILLSTIGQAAGLGDVTFEDITYQVLINSLPYNAVYYDIFDETNTLDSVSSGISYDANTTAYIGAAGDQITHTVSFGSGNLHDKVLIHVETDSSYTLQLDFGPGFQAVAADTDVLSDASGGDVNSVTFRFTFGSGGGSLLSYGLFFDDGDPPFSLARLYETLVLPAAISAGSDITIPNFEQYIDNGKSLQVFRQSSGDNGGTLQTISDDYTEKDTRTITVNTSGGWAIGDKITFVENYTQIDVSKDNTTRLNLEHNTAGNHILIDTITGTSYKLEIQDGVLELIPQ